MSRGGKRPGAGRPRLAREPLVRASTSLPRTRLRELVRRARREGVSLSQYLREVLLAALKD